MVYFIILQPISQTSREKCDQLPKLASQPVWSVPFDNMGAERKKAALPGASQQITADRRQCVPGVKASICFCVSVFGWAGSRIHTDRLCL